MCPPIGIALNPPTDDSFGCDQKTFGIKTLPQHAATLAKELKLNGDDPETLASVGEFLLEGLYVNNRLSKFNKAGKTFFRR